MTWLSANAGTIVVLVILLVIVGLILWKMISDRRKGITVCDTCASADNCAIHAAGKTCGDPKEKVADMEPKIKKVR